MVFGSSAFKDFGSQDCERQETDLIAFAARAGYAAAGVCRGVERNRVVKQGGSPATSASGEPPQARKIDVIPVRLHNSAVPYDYKRVCFTG